MDCPDTDGIVFIKNNINIKKNKNKIKDFVECKIIDTQNYDLIAEIVKK
jgi:tRNA A37 methylthiotransferase MiaB